MCKVKFWFMERQKCKLVRTLDCTKELTYSLYPHMWHVTIYLSFEEHWSKSSTFWHTLCKLWRTNKRLCHNNILGRKKNSRHFKREGGLCNFIQLHSYFLEFIDLKGRASHPRPLCEMAGRNHLRIWDAFRPICRWHTALFLLFIYYQESCWCFKLVTGDSTGMDRG